MDLILSLVQIFCTIFMLIYTNLPVDAQQQQIQTQQQIQHGSMGHKVRCRDSPKRENVTLLEGFQAGKFTKHGMVEDMKSCVDKCCEQKRCNLAFKLGNVCYGVVCKSQRSCSILPSTEHNSFSKAVISHVYRQADGTRNKDLGQNYPNVFESSDIFPNQYGPPDEANLQNHEVKPIENQGEGIEAVDLQNKSGIRIDKGNVKLFGSTSVNKVSSSKHSDILQKQIADIEHNKKPKENIFAISNQMDKSQLQSSNYQNKDKTHGNELNKSQNNDESPTQNSNRIMSKLGTTESSKNNDIGRLQNKVGKLRTSNIDKSQNIINKLLNNDEDKSQDRVFDRQQNISKDKKDSPEKTSKNYAPTDSSPEEDAHASTCSFFPTIFRKTIVGGLRRHEEVNLLGMGHADADDCAGKCCRHENCKAAVIHDNKCYAVQCQTRGYCDGYNTDDANAAIIYVKSRDGETLDRRERCRRHCGSGTCVNDDTCVCDTGVIGEHCEKLEPACSRRCGPHGLCNLTSDTCVCEEGWEGPNCDNQILCDPPCKNGTCVNAYTNACKCNIGWSGVFCHEVNGDTRVMASTGEQVLFTDADIEPELAIKMPSEKPPLSKREEPVSAFTVAACCAMASLFLGVVVHKL